MSVSQRAVLFVSQLLAERTDWLSGRGPDKCFENGDGKQVVQICLRLLAKKGIVSFEHLTWRQQRYVPRDWFSEKYCGSDTISLF